MSSLLRLLRLLHWPALLLLGASVVVLGWATLTALTGRQAGVLAIVAGIEAAVMLRLGGMRPGRWRAVAAVSSTVTMVLVANWLISASLIGQMMGHSMFEAAWRIGPTLALSYSFVRQDLLTWVMLGIGAAAAWWLAR